TTANNNGEQQRRTTTANNNGEQQRRTTTANNNGEQQRRTRNCTDSSGLERFNGSGERTAGGGVFVFCFFALLQPLAMRAACETFGPCERVEAFAIRFPLVLCRCFPWPSRQLLGATQRTTHRLDEILCDLVRQIRDRAVSVLFGTPEIDIADRATIIDYRPKGRPNSTSVKT
ncbi:MAG: hypothetical protein ABI442_06010, partial [Gemmatimonadaceae bacterium]